MFRSALPAVLALWPGLAAAENTQPTADEGCETIPYSQSSCVRVLACIGTNGDWFDGAVRGRGSGTVSGTISTGVTCSGTWTADGPFGAGVAEMTCDDGTTVGVIYYVQDETTGTVTGRGTTSDGRPVEAWTGERVLDFLSESTGEPMLACGDYQLLLS